MNPSCFSDCRLAQCSLACSHHIHCSHLLHPQVLVVACFTFVVKKNYLTNLHTTYSIYKRGSQRILYLGFFPLTFHIYLNYERWIFFCNYQLEYLNVHEENHHGWIKKIV